MLFALPWQLLLLLLPLNGRVQAQYTVTWLVIHQYYNQRYINAMRSNITQPDRRAFNLEIELAQRIANERLILSVNLLRPRKTELVHLLDLEFAVCDFVEQRLQQKLLKFIYAAMELYTNIPKRCPIAAGFVIRSHNFSMQGYELPLVTPELNFYTNLTMLTAPPHQERILSLAIQGRVSKGAK